MAALQEELGDRVLIELVEQDGLLYVVLVAGHGCRLRSLGPVSDVERQRAALHFG